MSFVKKEGAKKRKIGFDAALSVTEMKEMYSLDEDGLEIVDMDESEEEEKMEDEEEKIDDEVVMIGSGPEITTFPHSRHDCLLHPIQGKSKTFKMKNFCENCFCFVCDVKVAECTHWKDHCMAVNNAHWQGERKRMQIQKSIGKMGDHVCLACGGTGQRTHSQCWDCCGTGFLVQCPFKTNTKVTCKTHLGPIPKNVIASVTHQTKIKDTNDDGKEIAFCVPELTFNFSGRTVRVHLRTKDELKQLVSCQSGSIYYNQWPVGLKLRRKPTHIELIKKNDLDCGDFSGQRKYMADWVTEFSGTMSNLVWRRRRVDSNGRVINSTNAQPYAWHIQTTQHIPRSVQVINMRNNNTRFLIPEDLVKATKDPLKGLTMPPGLSVMSNVRRCRDSKHNHLKGIKGFVSSHYGRKRWFPDNMVGYVQKIFYDAREVKYMVDVKFNPGVEIQDWPSLMRFDAEQVEITKEKTHCPIPSFIPSTLRGYESFASDLKATRVVVKPGSHTAKHSNFKKNMIGLVRELKFDFGHPSDKSKRTGVYALVEVPLLKDEWYLFLFFCRREEKTH